MINNIGINDTDLLTLFRGGDSAAFKIIYERYWQLLYVAVYKVIKDEEEAKDVVQEVFISFLNRGTALEINGSLSSYLYTAVRYKVFDLISKKKVRADYLDSLNDYAETDNTTDQALIEKEIRTEIEKEIQNLPAKMKEVFELSRKAELSHKEIAETLNISDKTVKKQINNAIKILKPKFTNYYFIFYVGFSVLLRSMFKLF